jgi:hypothetical protein
LGGINTGINTDVEAYIYAYAYQLVYELANAHAILLGQGFKLAVEASGNNYMRKAFLSHVYTRLYIYYFVVSGF